MEWWYRSEKYSVSSEHKNLLEDLLKKELVESNSLGTANLYDDKECFYIKTTNDITLHTFLFKHGFEEIYDFNEQTENKLSLLYGND